MCGIAGIIALEHGLPIPEGLIVDMCDTMLHRGPDGEGYLFPDSTNAEYVEALRTRRPEAIVNHETFPRDIFLGHRRLSIVDLSSSAGQPMRSYDGKIWITFNGEVYNHLEIRKALIAKGYRFRTDHSDTEVILHAYQEWGREAVHHLRGMFAFAIYDATIDLLWIVRDRAGIKPLYFTTHEGCFYFASEIKAILAQKSIPRKMNNKGLYNYLTFLTVPPPETLFEGIYKLPAGYEIAIQDGIYKGMRQYWDVFDDVTLLKKSDEEVMADLDHLLTEAIDLRRQADVPYGVYLSGGVDSSANVSYLARMIDQPVKTFSVGYAHNEAHSTYKNEFDYSRKVAREFDCNAFEIEITQQQFLEFATNLVKYLDEPNADAVATSLYYVSKLAKDNEVTICLGGEGSDELFCGYIEWRYTSEFQRWAEILGKNALGRKLLDAAVNLPLIHRRRPFYAKWLRRLDFGENMFWGGTVGMEEPEKKSLISDKLKEELGDYSSWEAIKPLYHDFLQKAPEKHPLNWMSYLDLKFRLPDFLLNRLDKMAMAASIEGRVPFLDHHIISYAMSLPPNMKVRHKEEKYILKKTLEGKLPREIIYRDKVGFGAPIYEWFWKELGDYANEKILRFNASTGVFDEKALQQILKKREGQKSWYLLNLALWWEAFIEPMPVPSVSTGHPTD